MKALKKTLVSAAVLASVLVGAAPVGAGDFDRGDEFEPNSKRDLALQIFTGQPQLHTINPDGDEDWIMFVPRQSGRYVLAMTNVTIDLEGELWVQSGRDKEKRVEKFKIDRGSNSEIHLDVAANIGYFKIRIEADDNDDVGSYRLDVTQVSSSTGPQLDVRRPDIFESDNRREAAIGIRDNTTQLHTIYPRDDEDWLLFAPPRPGEYLLKISGVTADLEGEVWIRRGDDKERRVGKFEVSRWGRTIPLSAKHGVRYFKIRLEADDNDNTGDYRVEVVARPVVIIEPAVIRPTVIRQTVIRPTLRTPPIYRRPHTTIYTHRPTLHGRSSHGHNRYSGRSAGIIPRILGSLLGNTGRVRVGVSAGRSTRTAPTSSRSRGTVPRVHSRSQTPTRSTVRTPDRTNTRSATPTRSTVRTPARTPARSATPTRSTVRTPSRTPSRTTSVTPGTRGSVRGSTVRARVGVGGRRR